MNKEAPKGWKSNKLANICLIRGGKRLPKGETLSDIPTSHPYIRVTDFERYSVNLDNIKYITDEIYNVIKNYTISSDDLYISIAGSTGMIGTIPEKLNGANLTENAAKIVIKDQNIIDKNYLKYYLNSSTIQQQIKELTVGVGVPKLALNRIEGINIVYPNTIAEQREIAQVLDTMSDIIRLREECISHAQDLIPALFQEMFKQYINQKDKHVSIGSVTSDTKQINPSKIFDTDFYYIDIASINNDTGIIETPKIININDAPSRARKLVQTNDVIISMTRPYLKGFSIVPERLDGQIASTGFSVLRSIPEKLSPLYLFAYARTDMFVEQLIPKMKGANYPAVRDSDVRSVKIPLPPIELQEQFAQKAIEIESYIEEQQEELENAKQMFQSLLHHAFTGELTRRAYGN